jgi:hypothetical protein
MEINMRRIKFSFLILFILFYGCASPPISWHIELTYLPQENVIPLDENDGLGIKVKINDLRDKAIDLRDKNEVGTLHDPTAVPPTDHPDFNGPIIAKNDLVELTAHAIEAELINRGFELGEGVLVEIDFVKLYCCPTNYGFFTFLTDDLFGSHGFFSELILHVDVKNKEGTHEYSKLIRGKGGKTGRSFVHGAEIRIKNTIKTSLEIALHNGIYNLVNDPDFINALN